MSHTTWFYISLVCLHCGQETANKETQMYTSGLLLEPIDSFVEKGGIIEAELEDFKEAYFIRRMPESSEFFALEQWHCKHCGTTQWAKLSFQQGAEDSFRFVDAVTITLSAATLSDIAFITRKAEYWIKDNSGAASNALREAVEKSRSE